MTSTRGTGVRLGPVGVRLRRRPVLAATVVGAAVVAITLAGLLTGALALPVDRVLAALAGQGTSVEALVVDRRLTRVLAALVVGAALGCSGALTQTITRNPIASPDILGVVSGASAAAVWLAVRPESAEVLGVPAHSAYGPAAIGGGFAAAALILALSWRAGFDGYRVVLVGIGVNALALAVVSWLLTRADLQQAAVATRWLAGSLDGVRREDLITAVAVLPALVVSLVLADRLGALRLGRDVAMSLGVRTARTEAVALLLSVLLASVATAVAGPVAFVAFVAPQAAMRLFGTAGPPPLAGAITGALLLLVADSTAQALPVPLPVGIITSIVGAPFLLYLMIRSLRRRSA